MSLLNEIQVHTHKGFPAYPEVYPWVCKSTQGYVYVYSSPGIQVNIPRSIPEYTTGYAFEISKILSGIPSGVPKDTQWYTPYGYSVLKIPECIPCVYSNILGIHTNTPTSKFSWVYNKCTETNTPVYPGRIEYTLAYASECIPEKLWLVWKHDVYSEIPSTKRCILKCIPAGVFFFVMYTQSWLLVYMSRHIWVPLHISVPPLRGGRTPLAFPVAYA